MRLQVTYPFSLDACGRGGVAIGVCVNLCVKTNDCNINNNFHYLVARRVSCAMHTAFAFLILSCLFVCVSLSLSSVAYIFRFMVQWRAQTHSDSDISFVASFHTDIVCMFSQALECIIQIRSNDAWQLRNKTYNVNAHIFFSGGTKRQDDIHKKRKL